MRLLHIPSPYSLGRHFSWGFMLLRQHQPSLSTSFGAFRSHHSDAAMLSWFFRCIPLWSTIIFLLITVRAFLDSLTFVRTSTNDDSFRTKSTCFTPECWQTMTVAQVLYVVYTLILQIQFIVWTPQITLALYQHARKVKAVRRRRIAKNVNALQHKSDDFGAESDSDDSIAIELPDQTSVEDNILHAIVIPNYTEDLDTLRETLSVLARHPRAQQQYEVRFSQTA